MARPRSDGTPSAPIRRQRLTDAFVRTVAPDPKARTLYWDAAVPGLTLAVQPSGHRSWRFTYRAGGRVRVFTIGRVEAVGLADARDRARDLLGQVARKVDPQAEKMKGAKAETFDEVATRYFTEHAMKVNRAWKNHERAVRRHLLPRWAKIKARDVTRSDVRAIIRGLADTPAQANLVLGFTSSIFGWAIREEVGGVTVNPCTGIERHELKSRERVLSDTELPVFWTAFDEAGLIGSAALKTVLLTGQRPGEVQKMRREHIDGGWWRMPGAADPATGWPGTKNRQSHAVWLTEPVRRLIDECCDTETGFVFAGCGRLADVMRDVCAKTNIATIARPHDLRRTHGTTVCALGFGRDAMDRIQNHKEGGIGSVYDRHDYADESRAVQEAVTKHLLGVVHGEVKSADIVRLPKRRAA